MTRDGNLYAPPSEEAASDGKKKNRSLVGLIVAAVVFFTAPIVGAVVSMVLLSRAFDATVTVDPSQKARTLAEGISHAMNGAAAGLVVSLFALVSGIVLAVRLVRARRQPE